MSGFGVLSKKKKEDLRVGVASQVLGIISVVMALLFSAFGLMAAGLGLLGIICAAISRIFTRKNGFAAAGLVLSILGVVLGLLMFAACSAIMHDLGLYALIIL